jgi:hypothetical protein
MIFSLPMNPIMVGRSQRIGELEAIGGANDIFGGTPKITRGTRVLHSGNARFPTRGESKTEGAAVI